MNPMKRKTTKWLNSAKNSTETKTSSNKGTHKNTLEFKQIRKNEKTN